MSFFKNKILYLCLFFLILGVLVGGFLDANFVNKPISSLPNTPSLASILGSVSEFHAGNYKLINPLYECNTGIPYGTTQLLDLKNNIENYVDQLKSTSSVAKVSVQFRDLNTGQWFGINEHDVFSPSSLLKTPVMMAYFSQAQKDPSILNKTITYTYDPIPVFQQTFQSENPIQKGKTYTIEQLIERMIMGSDNAALGLLEQNIDNSKINQVTIDLGITTTSDSGPRDYMDVLEYSTLFRVLYYSTYLNKEYSEKALEILSKSEFNKGITALLSKDITVAHKYGERDIGDNEHQLHDCGIVYYPKHPYLLCIMTKGTNMNDLAKTLQQISKQIYTQFTLNNK